jgi:hypothetical protein
MCEGTPQSTSQWNRSLASAFHLRSWPIASLSRRPLPQPVRFFRSTAPSRFAPVRAASSRQNPLPLSRLALTATPLAFTPFWDLSIPPDHSAGKFCCSPVRLPVSPDLLSLPAAASIASFGRGSSFLVRYASGGSLFLKPLGTSFTMSPRPEIVKSKM